MLHLARASAGAPRNSCVTDLLQSSGFGQAQAAGPLDWRRQGPMRLIPREEKFYNDFQALADELHRGAELLEQMLAPERPAWGKAEEIKEVDHKCDFITTEII